jgi:phage protein D
MPAYPTYAPDFRISINGEAMPAAVRSVVTGVSYEDGKNAADRVEVSLANPDLRWLRKHIRGLGFQPFPTAVKLGPLPTQSLGEGTFDLDNRLDLSMGYAPDPLEEMFQGEVTGVDVSFPNGGMPTLKLVAHDYLQRLSQGTYAGGFGFLPDYLVAVILSARNLLIPAIEPSIQAISSTVAAINTLFTGTGLKQGAPGQGESDLAFIQRLAATYDADFWVEGDVLYMSRFIKEYEPRLTLTWGESLLDFSPRVSTVGQVAAVRMRFYLRELAMSFEVTVGWDFDRESLTTTVVPGVAAVAGPAVGGPALTIVDQPINSPGDIPNSALRILYELRKKLNQRLTGSGSAIGDPRIRAGAVIRLEGLGPDFSGNYRVASANHSIDAGGYRTTFQVFKEIIP